MLFKLSTVSVFLATLAQVKAAPTLVSRHEGHDDSTSAGTPASDIAKSNALEAQRYNALYATLKESDPCQGGDMACIDGAFATCVEGKWKLQKCAAGLRCYAEPHDLKEGTAIVCDTEERADLIFKSAGATGGTKGTDAADNDDEEGDDDIPDCEEGDEEEEGSPEEARFIHRRQEASTIVADLPPTAVPSSTVTRSSSAIPTSTIERDLPSTTAPSDTISRSSTSTPTSTLTSSSANPVITPTVVIGQDNIVTVTVVSTTTVSATDCAPASTSSALPRATVTSSSSVTPVTTVSTVSSSTSVIGASSVSSSETATAVSSTTVGTSSAASTGTSVTQVATTSASSAATVISLTTAPSTSTSLPTSTSGGLSFSTGSLPTPSA